MCIRFSSVTAIKNKTLNSVIEAKVHITVHGTPDKFLVDNGGEFTNAGFLNLAGIAIETTAAESS